MIRRLPLGSIVMCAALACSSGTTVEQFAPARSPGGIILDLRLRVTGVRHRFLAELVAVGDTALIVCDTKSVILVPLRTVRSGTTSTNGTGIAIGSGALDKNTRQRLTLLARFPQGLSPDLQLRLLAAYGQDSLEVIR
jgi:hypothetical protein